MTHTRNIFFLSFDAHCTLEEEKKNVLRTKEKYKVLSSSSKSKRDLFLFDYVINRDCIAMEKAKGGKNDVIQRA